MFDEKFYSLTPEQVRERVFQLQHEIALLRQTHEDERKAWADENLALLRERDLYKQLWLEREPKVTTQWVVSATGTKV